MERFHDERFAEDGTVEMFRDEVYECCQAGKKRWKKVVRTAKMLPYEVEKRWPSETTGGRRTGPAVSDRHPEKQAARLRLMFRSLTTIVHSQQKFRSGGRKAVRTFC